MEFQSNLPRYSDTRLSDAYWLNLKNCCLPEMEFVTVFCPVDDDEKCLRVVVQTGELRFVVDCRVNPEAVFVHVSTTLVPAGRIVSCGELTGPNERLNTVPENELPPPDVVPYSVLPEKISPAIGVGPIAAPGEIIEGREAGAVAVELEQSSVARTAAILCCSIQGVT